MHLAFRGPRCCRSSCPSTTNKRSCRNFTGGYQRCSSRSPATEIVFANDGSRDATGKLLEALHDRDPRVAVVDLSRNFGKKIALTAGLNHGRSDAVVVIDADLQDPPELIPELVKYWREGYDVVYARRSARDSPQEIDGACFTA